MKIMNNIDLATERWPGEICAKVNTLMFQQSKFQTIQMINSSIL